MRTTSLMLRTHLSEPRCACYTGRIGKTVIVCICESDRDELTQKKEGHKSQYWLHHQPHKYLDEFPVYKKPISNGCYQLLDLTKHISNFLPSFVSNAWRTPKHIMRVNFSLDV
jgi:hypothetical protein